MDDFIAYSFIVSAIGVGIIIGIVLMQKHADWRARSVIKAYILKQKKKKSTDGEE